MSGSCTVAIVNWNSGSRLRTCIESLNDADILVIDNASNDDSLDSLAASGRKVNFVRNAVNRGFAAAVNQAFHATSSAYVLVLNPDVRSTSRAVHLLKAILDTNSRAAAVAGYAGDKYLPRTLPTVLTLTRENLGLGKGTRGRPPTPPTPPFPVEQPAAAALMIRRAAFDDVGGFDERFYPAWYEDVDFCRRLKAKGWEIYFAPEAEFQHEGGYSARTMGSESFLRAYYSNQLRYAQKHFGVFGAAAVRASIAAGMLVRMIGRPADAGAYGKAFIGALAKW